ncbi:MAG: IS66 family transposase [Proteobacteria bacterium]|nr:IS66 family transposase [Pseudomonadota bacterium]
METLGSSQSKFSGLSEKEFIEIIAKLQAENFKLRSLLFSSRRERYKEDPTGMKLLFNEVEEASIEPLEDSPKEESQPSQNNNGKGDGEGSGKNRGKRRPLPDHLPRIRNKIDLADNEKICSDHNQPLVRIGETITEKLEIEPAKVYVRQDAVQKYKCPCCENNFKAAEPPSSIIPKSFVTPGLLAFIITGKYVDGLPLYRIARIFNRISVDLGRTTMARWVIKSFDAAKPLIQLLSEDLLNSKVVHIDETVIQVLKEANKSPESKSYIWCLARQGSKPIIFYRYNPNRSKGACLDVLNDYKGTIVCDGYKVYDSVARISGIQIAGCMAHARRKFWDAEKFAKKEANKNTAIIASQALKFIKDLYLIERKLRGLKPEEMLLIRQNESLPIMEKFHDWLLAMEQKVLPSSPTGKAIAYTLGQWKKLLVFANDASVPIDNNYLEAKIRPFVVGRDAWKFSDTVAGADASAGFYTLVETCKANGVDPHDYLTLIFKELPLATTVDALEKLLPYNAKDHWPLKPYIQSM